MKFDDQFAIKLHYKCLKEVNFHALQKAPQERNPINSSVKFIEHFYVRIL